MNAKFDSSRGTRLYSYDTVVEEKIANLTRDFSLEKLMHYFPMYIRRVWLKKFIAHYELFRKIKNLDGDVVELGVFRGLSLFSFAHFNEFLLSQRRTIYGIDNFTGFTKLVPEDGPEYDIPKHRKGFSPAKYLDELKEGVKTFNKKAGNTQIQILIGNVEDVVARFSKRKNRLALIHFDVDLYVPTKAGLSALYPLLVPGGVICFDEYGLIEWSGETRAADEYFQGKKIKIKKFPWQGAPSGYLIKPY